MSILKQLTKWLNKPKDKLEELERKEPTVPKDINLTEASTSPDKLTGGEGVHLHLTIHNSLSNNKETHSIDKNRQELAKLSAYVKEMKHRVQNPDFLESGKFAPQWKSGWGDDKYYQLPNKQIIAIIKNGEVIFNKEGITL